MSGIPELLEDIAREVRERPKVLAFSEEEYRGRLDRLRAAMARDGIDLVLLYSMDAMCWLHGHQLRWYKASSPRQWPPLACTAVHADHDALILFEGLEHRDLVWERSVAKDVRLTERAGAADRLSFTLGELRAEGWLAPGTRVGVEQWAFLPNHAVATQLDAALTGAGCTVLDATDTIRGVRAVKSAAELETIERAAAICDLGLARLQAVLAPGVTELEAWGEMMLAMARAGGEPAGIHELVSVGDVHRNHAWSSDRVLQEGDALWADPCGVRRRYHANVARSFFVGEVPEAAARLGEIEAGAYHVLCSVARPGVLVNDVSAALQGYYEDAGVWDLRGSGWVGAYELGVSFPPDWVGDFCWTVGEDAGDAVIEAGTVTNYESVIGLVMIDTIVYGEDATRALGRTPRAVLGSGGGA